VKKYLLQLQNVFQDFDYGLVKCSPLPICILINNIESAKQDFRQYLLNKNHLSTHDIHIILTYLGQIDFRDEEILGILKDSSIGNELVSEYSLSAIPSNQPGYFNISDTHLEMITEMPQFIEQISLRIQSERKGEFSVALNHLVNELQAICFCLDSSFNKSIKHYNQDQVNDFLSNIGIQSSQRKLLSVLYKGRHSNSISHAGSINDPVISVSKDDYLKYREQVGKYIKKILEAQLQVKQAA